VLRQCLLQRSLAPAVLRSLRLEVRIEVAAAEEPGEESLHGVVGAGVHDLLGVDQQLLQLGCGVDPADAETGCDDLREGAHREDQRVAFGELVQGRHRIALEAQRAVGIVVDDDAAPRLRELEQPAAALERQGGARRVLERGDRVDGFGGAAGPVDEVFQDVDLHPVPVDRDLEEIGLVGQCRRAAVGVGR
jgi:hypothetical protein